MLNIRANTPNRNPLFYLSAFFISVFVFILAGCGSGSLSDLPTENTTTSQPVDALGNYSGDVVIDLLEDSPKISLQSDGRTNIVLQFIPRDSNGFSLSSEQIDIDLLIDDTEVSVESYLQSDASELQFNVNFGLVLDASYSMVDRNAFEPMLKAASESVQSGITIWESKSGTFNFHTTWFNDFIYSADQSTSPWTATDILSIAPPASSIKSSTKLFAAVDYMVDKLNKLPTLDKQAQAPQDQNIILVFSDGKDEYSWYDNADIETENGITDSGAEYIKMGYKAIDLNDPDSPNEDLIPNIEQSKNLTIHVIGLGDTIVENDLLQIAKAGRGTFRKNPDAEDLNSVFNKVVQEFTTLQTRGVSIPKQPGTYTFTLRVTNRSGNKFAEYSFDFRTDSEAASIIQPE